MPLIAAIDLWKGQAVRLRQGDFSSPEVISQNPLEVGEKLLQWGISWWHIVDLEGAKEGKLIQKALLSAMRRSFPDVRMNLAGGLRTREAVEWGAAEGFDYLVIGSAAVEAPTEVQQWLKLYSPQRFILATDLKGSLIAIRGWQTAVALPVKEFFTRWIGEGVQTFLCTEVERDGMMSGPNLALYQELVAEAHPADIIASGGIRHSRDIRALEALGVKAVIVGKALYKDPQAFGEILTSA
ncbi:MAG: 1-(5-phosphoribosyl)-5-[(5-phosphoribosylamino)methylideneamino] imidazole-4-carboxamide isomerase [Bacteroidia bacterium]|nr:1-(5-phosphoribosyl)-5-[(5-phosphoribosylamino)methylideneamino] imidazole-4-carboxamide isomerase [Bacteroidia bacterium]MCX7764722.1 1-(5-phosphoribosyl)-5-[(5-phosphoribosylamino)methylideneamino] imidazole-4-carboxamide isomerase [Bacteroidia bacterium]MDW8057372.1 1-(5-phosphoribosyl)-5-[(5-phosphoribosylamino)methylideneamino] imidazole-4-carboxamide isomerase [Bacteroidia bacterium]